MLCCVISFRSKIDLYLGQWFLIRGNLPLEGNLPFLEGNLKLIEKEIIRASGGKKVKI